jgi:putative hydrolase of the HAD superfamily
MRLPGTILLDLDDTILSFSSSPRDFWQESLEAHALPSGLEPSEALEALRDAQSAYWAEENLASARRQKLRESRRDVALLGLRRLGVTTQLACDIADHYTRDKEAAMLPFPGALHALRTLKGAGHRLGLVTNGAGSDQRRKLRRFGLEASFDVIVIEGEWGVGKPDPSIFEEALARLGSRHDDALMVGDNLTADIRGAKRVGMSAVWIDHRGRGLPEDVEAPDAIIRQLPELLGQSGMRGA